MRKSSLKALVFAGTAEGRRACDYLSSLGVTVEAFVATSYGATISGKNSLVRVREGRLNAEKMKEILAMELARGETIVVDATHPHAVEVSDNIKNACGAAGAELFRILRPYSGHFCGTVVKNAREAALYLADKEGAVLITTGARDIGDYTSVIKDKKRLYARILPDSGVLDSCIKLGIEASRIFCMQGPFSKEMNAATLKSCGASFLVTKDSGPVGGMENKLAAAKEVGAEAVIIQRPVEEGYSFEEFREKISERLGMDTECAGKKDADTRIYSREANERISEKLSCSARDELPAGVGSASNDGLCEITDSTYGGHMPVFLRTSGEKALVIGGGTVGSRRAEKLFSFGMEVTIISPTLKSPSAELLAKKGMIKWIKRMATASDVSSSYKLIACCAGNPGLAEAMREKASELGVLYNAAEEKGKCDFFFPAVVAAKNILAAVISREGADHMQAADAAAFLRNKLCEYDEKN